MDPQKTLNCQSNLEKKKKKDKTWGNTLPDIRLYYKATVIKQYSIGTKHRHGPMG